MTAITIFLWVLLAWCVVGFLIMTVALKTGRIYQRQPKDFAFKRILYVGLIVWIVVLLV